jgi:protein-arginine kinase activator protein McsA
MQPRKCPECKSMNTRQMDKTNFGDQAYCLSCYNRFRSVLKTVSVPSRDSVRVDLVKMKIDVFRKKLDKLEKELNSCIQQDSTGAR